MSRSAYPKNEDVGYVVCLVYFLGRVYESLDYVI